ncbi:type II secretion system protein GspJ [Anatilimnocola floriformis]|uniref:type II secretion system protein GspJ n=1 Tax=Anatilimnocola floriformis TaxID=2948575 RepID=UPI0021BCADCD|nr:type II secretion system protein GspJ [Anatilimnocola floriformis]
MDEVAAAVELAVVVAAVELAVVVAAVAEEDPVDAKTTFNSKALRRGVTLLELLLALGLSTIVMALIAMSINLNFKMFDTRRTSIEESRLARSVLRHMADDIRAAVQHMPPDLKGLETVLGNSQIASNSLSSAGLGALTGATGQTGANGNQTGGTGAQGNNGSQNGQQQTGGAQNGTGGGAQNGTGGGTQTGTGGGTQTGTGTGGQTTTTTSGTTGSVGQQTAQAGSIYGDQQQAGGIIGVYGTSTELQIDISRLPRVDQFQAEVDPTQLAGVVDIPSDMKTVSYYLRPEEGMTDVGQDGRGRGLMRRVLDRAVSNYESSSGVSNGTLGAPELMAEEVVGLQFMYFDGASWSSEWDSASMEGLPVAIEITVILQSKEEQEAKSSGTASSKDEENERLYTLTVNLPTATSYDEKQQAAAAAEEETALSQSGSIDTSGDSAAAGMTGAGAGGLGAGMGGAGGAGQQGGGRGQNGGGQGGQGNGPGGNGGGPGGNGPGGNGGNGPGGNGGQGGGRGGQGQGGQGGGGRGGQGGQGGQGGGGRGSGGTGGGGARGGGGGGGGGGRGR